MDQRIADLKSTTFSGRRLRRLQIASIQQTVQMCSGLSRRELAHTICEHLNWKTPKGDDRVHLCLNMLEELEKLGIVSLPEIVEANRAGPQRRIQWTSQTDEQPTIDDPLAQLAPITLKIATEDSQIRLWNETVDRYHYLGYKRPIGPHLRYFIVDNQERMLGCLMFCYATKSVLCRDQWIGWQDIEHKKHLDLVLNNNRFLILPWVNVNCLASKALSIAARQLRNDWHQHHGYRPVLLETFVDPEKFDATCYRAANWLYLGDTEGRSASKNAAAARSPKGVFVYPLVKQPKAQLINGPKRKPRKKASNQAPKALTPTDPFVQLWQTIIVTLTTVATDFDRQWQKRRRVLNTQLIMLFIFRLVFSKNKQGYGITVIELWDQCRALGIPLPQSKPVAPSAFSYARAKLDENVFKVLQAEILKQYDPPDGVDRWKSHRLYAVDGSKVNLPRNLKLQGYKTPSSNAHYPQGLVSCLYQLKTKIPVDFDLVSHANERVLALSHLPFLSPGDVVVYDRGYFSHVMLYAHCARGIHPIFRLQSKSHPAVDELLASSERKADQIIHITPSRRTAQALREKFPAMTFKPIALRLVKYTVADSAYVLGTTLVDSQTYSVQDLCDVYHSRWGVEELYKVSKQLIGIEDFHGKTERGVKQELFAHFVLIAIARIFSNHSEASINSSSGSESRKTTVNFKNSLITVARHIEALLLQQAALVTATVTKILDGILCSRQKRRPGRSYERKSRKPVGKWMPTKPAKKKAAAEAKAEGSCTAA